MNAKFPILTCAFCLFTSVTIANEANLRAITFIDADRGWVAGERGTILHTQDGGVSWQPQSSATSAGLTAIAMFNSERGLAVGGSYQPYTQLSVGEVLVTKDGGQSWVATADHNLPRLRKLLVGPGGKCVAVGDWSPVHLSAVFESDDGGQRWRPRANNMVGSVIDLAGTVDDFLVLSESGAVARYQLDGAPQPLFPPDHEWRLMAANQSDRLLVGVRGAIRSPDSGESWEPIPQSTNLLLSLTTGQQGAASLLDDQICFAADGLSAISLLRSDGIRQVTHAGGASIRSLLRLDRDRGWAVGDYGLILTTRDGGQSWRVLRGGERSPAVLFVSSRGETLPWSLAAQESLQHQRRIAFAIDREGGGIPQIEYEQVVDACSSLGPVTIISAGDYARIAQNLQLSKPAVIVLDESISASQKSAWTTAATEVGVKRLLQVGTTGSQTIHVAAAMPAVGILASDVWVDAIARLAPGQLPPAKLMLTPLIDSTSDSADGLATCVRSDARYSWSRETTASRRQLQILQARVAEHNWVESLASNTRNPVEFKQLLAPVISRMDAEDRQRMFARLIAIAGSQSRQDLYLAALESLVETPPTSRTGAKSNHDQLRLAALRLDAIRASTEWRQTFGPAMALLPSSSPTAAAQSAVSPISLAVQVSPFQSPSSPVPDTSGTRLAGGFFQNDAMSSQRVQLASGQTPSRSTSKSAAIDLRWEFHPAVLLVSRNVERDQQRSLLPVAADESQPWSGTPLASTASTNLHRLAGLAAASRWGELATDNRSPDTLFAPSVSPQPYLDGSFDEPWWQVGQSFGNDSDAAMVRMAHDKDFIYFAIDAPALETSQGQSKSSVRQRDTPLDTTDRYRIRLDIDRDLLTAYEFEFDGEGNTRDSCDGFLAFQPRWFIACKQFGERTHAEIAIQKADLGTELESLGAIWNLAVDHLPGGATARGLSMPQGESWRPVMVR